MIPHFVRRLFHNIGTAVRGALAYLRTQATEQRIGALRMAYGLRTSFVLHMPHPVQGFKQGRSVRVWTDTKGFERMLLLVGRARRSLFIQMFIWKNDEAGKLFAWRVVRSANRGARVKIQKEASGDLFEVGADFLSTKQSTDPVWQAFWNHPNISIEHTAVNNHAKYCIIDQERLLLTGMNIGNEYHYDWHDYMIEIKGADYVSAFLEAKAYVKRGGIAFLRSDVPESDARTQVLALLGSAQRSIVLEQAYLSDPEVLDLLIKKSKERVRIVIILPASADAHSHANMQSAAKLLIDAPKKYLKIYLLPIMVHGKVILIDNKRALVGSVNLIKSSLDDMGEASVLIEQSHERAIAKLQRTLLRDIIRSKSLTDPPWFPLIRRLMAWLQL